MPQYYLPESNEPDFLALDPFTRGYIECLFFTNVSNIPMSEIHSEESQELIREGMADGELPEDAGFLDLHPDTLASIINECAKFQADNADLLDQAYELKRGFGEGGYPYNREYMGHDFWFTRNGHGVGFWDRRLGEVGDKLTEACKAYGEVYVYFTDPDFASPTGYGWVRTD